MDEVVVKFAEALKTTRPQNPLEYAQWECDVIAMAALVCGSRLEAEEFYKGATVDPKRISALCAGKYSDRGFRMKVIMQGQGCRTHGKNFADNPYPNEPESSWWKSGYAQIDGWLALDRGMSISENPYHLGSIEFSTWAQSYVVRLKQQEMDGMRAIGH